MKIFVFFLDTDGKRKRSRSRHWPWKKIGKAFLSLIVAVLPLIQEVGKIMFPPVTLAQIESYRIKPIEPLSTTDSVQVHVNHKTAATN